VPLAEVSLSEVPLGSFLFAAAICHAGIAAFPPPNLGKEPEFCPVAAGVDTGDAEAEVEAVASVAAVESDGGTGEWFAAEYEAALLETAPFVP